jgi:hypothetical protein
VYVNNVHLGQKGMKRHRTKRLGKKISKLICRRNMKSPNQALLNLFTYNGTVDLNVLRAFVVDMVGGYMQGSLAVTKHKCSRRVINLKICKKAT